MQCLIWTSFKRAGAHAKQPASPPNCQLRWRRLAPKAGEGGPNILRKNIPGRGVPHQITSRMDQLFVRLDPSGRSKAHPGTHDGKEVSRMLKTWRNEAL